MDLTKRTIAEEIIVRVILLMIFFCLEVTKPRIRFIWKEEWWMYKNGRMDSYVTPHMLWLVLVMVGLILTMISTMMKKSSKHFLAAMFGYSLALLATGNVTNVIKLSVGRCGQQIEFCRKLGGRKSLNYPELIIITVSLPRPDFFYRCYPDGFERPQCSGTEKEMMDGRKSFPSGHSSLCWCALSYLSFYLLANLRILSAPAGNGHLSEDHVTVLRRRSIMRLLIALLPCCLAFVIALSRVIDHHHHIEDVTVGSLLGLTFSYACYRYYFPSLNSGASHLCQEEYFQMLFSTNATKSLEQII